MKQWKIKLKMILINKLKNFKSYLANCEIKCYHENVVKRGASSEGS